MTVLEKRGEALKLQDLSPLFSFRDPLIAVIIGHSKGLHVARFPKLPQ